MSVDDAVAVAGRLRSCGAARGAGTVAFNALLMTQAEARANRRAWSPWGATPLASPANDTARPSSSIPDLIA